MGPKFIDRSGSHREELVRQLEEAHPPVSPCEGRAGAAPGAAAQEDAQVEERLKEGSVVVRAWERQEGETSRAYEAFSVYRDLGPARSLANVGQMLGKSKALMERWSAAHSWVDRVAALEARDEMQRREAVDEYLASQAEDHAEREGRIAELLLTVREEAAQQALSMVRWPLSEQRILQEDQDGNEITVILMPTKWSKHTALGMARLAAGAVPGLAPVREDSDEADAGWDLSRLSESELETFLTLSEKICVQGKKRPGK